MSGPKVLLMRRVIYIFVICEYFRYEPKLNISYNRPLKGGMLSGGGGYVVIFKVYVSILRRRIWRR